MSINVEVKVVEVTNIASLIIQLLMMEKVNEDGTTKTGFRHTNKEIAQKCVDTFPGAETTPACVAWYSSHLKKPAFRKKRGISQEVWERLGNLKADKN